MNVYYNEWDADCAERLAQLMAAGSIPPGVIDRRDIRDVCPSDLAGFTQCHRSSRRDGKLAECCCYSAHRPTCSKPPFRLAPGGSRFTPTGTTKRDNQS